MGGAHVHTCILYVHVWMRVCMILDILPQTDCETPLWIYGVSILYNPASLSLIANLREGSISTPFLLQSMIGQIPRSFSSIRHSVWGQLFTGQKDVCLLFRFGFQHKNAEELN